MNQWVGGTNPRTTTVVTVTEKEYDEEGRLVKETVTETRTTYDYDSGWNPNQPWIATYNN